MDYVTAAFEKLAVLFRPLGVILGLAAVALFILKVLGLTSGPQESSWPTTLAMLWVGWLAVLIYWFKPSSSEAEANGISRSAASRFGRFMQLYVTGFFLVGFIFLAFITAVVMRDAG